VFRRDGDAYARVHNDLLALQDKGGLQHIHEIVRHLFGARGVGAGQQNGEFITAKARHHCVVLYRALEAPGDLLQQEVANLMA
jgi:hypothetical protein